MQTEPNWDTWLGREERVHDTLDPILVNRMAATFGHAPLTSGDALPALWHWAFFIQPVGPEEIGPDGHPALGRFMPPALGRNRMWAGGRVRFFHALRVGHVAERHTTIQTITEKAGRTGSLLFVTLLHRYLQDDVLMLEEEQDIVYRQAGPPKLDGTELAPSAQWTRSIQPDPVLLFRYSAVTFNGHRIHYDDPYSTQQEGYPGLVVHGPMIATLLLHSALAHFPEHEPTQFNYRGLRPLICPDIFHLEGRERQTNELELWAQQDGTQAQKAELYLKERI